MGRDMRGTFCFSDGVGFTQRRKGAAAQRNNTLYALSPSRRCWSYDQQHEHQKLAASFTYSFTAHICLLVMTCLCRSHQYLQRPIHRIDTFTDQPGIGFRKMFAAEEAVMSGEG